MKTVVRWCVLILLLVGWRFGEAQEAISGGRRPRSEKTVLVHYMPWYSSQPFSGFWGWHWTMNAFDPEKKIPSGKREIASHDYPLIGPYDSNDPAVLECHVLLMKIAGIDGVVLDWYGREAFRDYAEIHRNCVHLIKILKKAKMQFCICYEDQTIGHRLSAKHIEETQTLVQGKKILRWLDQNWFSDPAYVRWGDRPILLIFGPQFFKKQDWKAMVDGLPSRPMLFGLPHLVAGTGMDGSFGWPPVSGGKEITVKVWQDYLKRLETKSVTLPTIASVFPGFKDIYQQAKVSPSHGWIDQRDGKTLKETWSFAMRGRSPIVQIATWNDFGEGTVVEPTDQNGYRFLEMIQNDLRQDGNAKMKAQLRIPIRLYLLKKKVAQNGAAAKKIKQITDLLFRGDFLEAQAMLAKLEGNLPF